MGHRRNLPAAAQLCERNDQRSDIETGPPHPRKRPMDHAAHVVRAHPGLLAAAPACVPVALLACGNVGRLSPHHQIFLRDAFGGRHHLPLVDHGDRCRGDEPQGRGRLSTVARDEPDQHRSGPRYAEAAVRAYPPRRLRTAAAGAARPATVAHRQRPRQHPDRDHGRVHDGHPGCADRDRARGLDVLSRLGHDACRGGVLSAGGAAHIEHRADDPEERIPDRTADRQLDLRSRRAFRRRPG